jgi:hypothetical protein
LLVDRPEQLLEHAEVVVVASAEKEFLPLLGNLSWKKTVIDLVGLLNTAEGHTTTHMESYAGIAW